MFSLSGRQPGRPGDANTYARLNNEETRHEDVLFSADLDDEDEDEGEGRRLREDDDHDEREARNVRGTRSVRFQENVKICQHTDKFSRSYISLKILL